jgi:hypothetical protein
MFLFIRFIQITVNSMSNAAPAISFSILFLNAVIFIFRLIEKKLSNHTNFQWKIKEETLDENPGNFNIL